MDRENMEYRQKTDKVRSGAGKGILIGVLLTILAGITAVNVFSLVTGNRFVLVEEGAARAEKSGGELLDDATVSKINELTAYVDLYYYDEAEKEKLRDGLCSGLISGLDDRYSVYYNPEEYQQMQIDTTGKYYGIGAGLLQDKDSMLVSVSRVYEGTPSEKAGLRAKDVILSVDGTEADTMDVTELVKLIRGEEGTSVHLEVYRPVTSEYLSFDVERENVTLPSITSEMIADGIGYLRIESFESETAAQFEAAVEQLRGQGMKSLVIDLRYNGGGLVESVVQILDNILPGGLLVYTEDKNGKREEYKSDDATKMDYPLAVLINQDSASASEIFAGAIKDFEYGTLIGTTTFGKGIVQTIFRLNNGDAVKLTTAKYFTPKGNFIHGVGIEPDIELEYEYLNPEGEEYEMQYDNQIQKAIEVLSGE